MSDPIRLAVAGSTGLVGWTIIERFRDMEEFRLVAISRREVKLPKGVKMEMRLAEPELWGDVLETVKPDVLVCALGTTWRKAGKNEAAFREVDQKLVLHLANAAKAAGVRHFIFVSSIGADVLSKRFYLKVKGEVEEALGKLRFTRLDILRPGLLRGKRRNDRRFLEGVGQVVAPLVDLFLRGPRRKYRSIKVEVLVDAILGLAREKAGGRFIHEHNSLVFAAKRYRGH